MPSFLAPPIVIGRLEHLTVNQSPDSYRDWFELRSLSSKLKC